MTFARTIVSMQRCSIAPPHHATGQVDAFIAGGLTRDVPLGNCVELQRRVRDRGRSESTAIAAPSTDLSSLDFFKFQLNLKVATKCLLSHDMSPIAGMDLKTGVLFGRGVQARSRQPPITNAVGKCPEK